MGVVRVYLHPEYAAAQITSRIARGPIYQNLERMYGIAVTEVRQDMTATVLDKETADLLQVAPGDPALQVVRFYYSTASTTLSKWLSVTTQAHAFDRVLGIRCPRQVGRQGESSVALRCGRGARERLGLEVHPKPLSRSMTTSSDVDELTKSFSRWHLSADPHEGAVVPASTALFGLTAGQFAASSISGWRCFEQPAKVGENSPCDVWSTPCMCGHAAQADRRHRPVGDAPAW